MYVLSHMRGCVVLWYGIELLITYDDMNIQSLLYV
jgi:hypothetical protein